MGSLNQLLYRQQFINNFTKFYNFVTYFTPDYLGSKNNMEFLRLLRQNFTFNLTNQQQRQTRYAMLFAGIASGLKMLYDNYKCDLEFICGNKKFKQDVIANCPSLSEGAYYPTIYLPTSQLQILYGNVIQKPPEMKYEKHDVISKKDGQKI